MLDGNQTNIEQLKKAFSDGAAPDEMDFASLISTFVIRRDLEIEAEELITELKALFSNGKCPTGADFAKLIDTFIPKTSTDFISFEDILPHVANLHEALEGINDRKLISALRLAQVLDQKKNYVSTQSIKNGAITSEKILNASVMTEKLADNSVVTSKILDSAVTSGKILNASIITDKLANNAVTSGKIADSAVTSTKLGSNAVTTTKIADATITTSKLADGCVTSAKLASNIVSSNTLADNSVTTSKIANGAITSAKLSTSDLKLPYNANGVGATGLNSTAFGNQALASGVNSVALGTQETETTSKLPCKASGKYSLAVGTGSQASGEGAIALGVMNVLESNVLYYKVCQVTGNYSIAIGAGPQATKRYSVALGFRANATADGTTALGDTTIAQGESSTAVGRYAAAYRTDGLALGCGAQAWRNGSTAIGFHASSRTANTIQLGGDEILRINCNKNIAVPADERDLVQARNIEINKALEILKRLRPVSFHLNLRSRYAEKPELTQNKLEENNLTPANAFDEEGALVNFCKIAHQKAEKKDVQKSIGFSAQEVEKVLEEITGDKRFGDLIFDTADELEIDKADSEMSICYANFVPLLIGAFQQQEKNIEIERQKTEILEDLWAKKERDWTNFLKQYQQKIGSLGRNLLEKKQMIENLELTLTNQQEKLRITLEEDQEKFEDFKTQLFLNLKSKEKQFDELLIKHNQRIRDLEKTLKEQQKQNLKNSEKSTLECQMIFRILEEKAKTENLMLNQKLEQLKKMLEAQQKQISILKEKKPSLWEQIKNYCW